MKSPWCCFMFDQKLGLCVFTPLPFHFPPSNPLGNICIGLSLSLSRTCSVIQSLSLIHTHNTLSYINTGRSYSCVYLCFAEWLLGALTTTSQVFRHCHLASLCLPVSIPPCPLLSRCIPFRLYHLLLLSQDFNPIFFGKIKSDVFWTVIKKSQLQLKK